jgi:hypothetical protein
METTRKTDPVLEALTEVMAEWHRAFGNTPTLVKDVVAKANQTTWDPRSGKTVPAHPGLRDALLAVAGRGGAIDNQALGIWLGKQRNRVANKRRFTKGSETGGAPKWVLEDA